MRRVNGEEADTVDAERGIRTGCQSNDKGAPGGLRGVLRAC